MQDRRGVCSRQNEAAKLLIPLGQRFFVFSLADRICLLAKLGRTGLANYEAIFRKHLPSVMAAASRFCRSAGVKSEPAAEGVAAFRQI